MSDTPQAYTIEQILEYLDCSLCYHLKYVQKIPLPEAYRLDDKNNIYRTCMEETITYYYTGHMEKNPPTLKQMYDKFYTLWMERTKTTGKNSVFTRRIEDASQRKREETSKFVTRGYEAIQGFYQENARLKQSVLAVQHPYQVQLKDVTVTGRFPLIREVMGREKRRRIQIVSFPSSTRKPEEDALQRDLTVTMSAFAFRQVFQAEPDEILLHYVNRKEIIPVSRSSNDYRRLFSVLDAFLQSVDTIPPFPRPGGHKGYAPYKEFCNHYQFSPNLKGDF